MTDENAVAELSIPELSETVTSAFNKMRADYKLGLVGERTIDLHSADAPILGIEYASGIYQQRVHHVGLKLQSECTLPPEVEGIADVPFRAEIKGDGKGHYLAMEWISKGPHQYLAILATNDPDYVARHTKEHYNIDWRSTR